MKKVIMLLSIFFLLASCTQVKIAYVDVDEILKEYEGAKVAEEEIKVESQRLAAQIQQQVAVWQQKAQEHQQNSANLSATVKQQKEQELMQEQQQIQQGQQMVQQQIQALGQEKIEELNEDIESFLEDYAKLNGFTYILGTSEQTKAVMYGEESLNITDEVIEALNNDYKSDEKTEDNPE